MTTLSLDPPDDDSLDDVSPDQKLWNTGVADDLAFLLARANALSLAQINDALAKFDLKIRLYSVLTLAASGARPTQRELSEFLRLDPSQVVTLVDHLEERKLVIRETDERDRRAKVIVATPEGADLSRRAKEAVRVSEKLWFSILDKEDAQRLGPILRVIAGVTSGDHHS